MNRFHLLGALPGDDNLAPPKEFIQYRQVGTTSERVDSLERSPFCP